MTHRSPDYSLDPLFVQRWSPRAFDASTMPETDLNVLFEAARWAPSAFNLQPWSYLYARREDPDWPLFLSLLIPFNQSWAQNASVLIFALSRTFEDTKSGRERSYSHSFDTGAAWAYLALQASLLGYSAHGMTGIEVDRARRDLRVPDDHRIEAAIAVGRRASPETLPEPLRGREQPSSRKPISEFVRKGVFS